MFQRGCVKICGLGLLSPSNRGSNETATTNLNLRAVGDGLTQSAQALEKFWETCKTQREKISTEFAHIRNVVAEGERAALSAFDQCANTATKLLHTFRESCDVLNFQFSALLNAGLPIPSLTGTLTLPSPNVHVSFVGIKTLECMLRDCCTVVNTETPCEIQQEIMVLQAQAALLKETRVQVLNDLRDQETCTWNQLDKVKLEMFWKRKTNPAGLPFLGRQLATFGTSSDECHSGGIAVSRDGTLVAISSMEKHRVALFALPNGNFTRYIGSGNGQLNSPRRICFSFAGDSILIANCNNCRLVEMSLTGQQQRVIQLPDVDSIFPNFVGVDANADVIVASGVAIFVFEYKTGSFIKKICCDTRGCFALLGVRLSPDGDHFAVCDYKNRCVSVFTLFGQPAGTWDCDGIGVSDIGYLSSGEVAIAGDSFISLKQNSSLPVERRKRVVCEGSFVRSCTIGDFVLVALSSQRWAVFG